MTLIQQIHGSAVSASLVVVRNSGTGTWYHCVVVLVLVLAAKYLLSRWFLVSPRCRVQLWTSCLHTRASVTKQYNLVPADGRWSWAVWEVNASCLVESNDSLPPGLWLQSPGGWLPGTGISSGTLYTLVSSMGLSLPYLLILTRC